MKTDLVLRPGNVKFPKNPIMDTLLDAILDDDRAVVQAMLKADPALVTASVRQAILHEAKIFHWLYVGDTALHLAAAGYRVEIVRMLLAAGADPNSAKNQRWSGPLHYAADGYLASAVWDPMQQVETLKCLLEAGADLQAQDKNGATPLHRAVRTRCAAATRFLLEAGSDATRQNKPGSTPFHLAVQDTGRGGSGTAAARAAQRQIIRDFLSFGVSTALKDGKGKTVLACAKSDWIRELLQTETA
ncbi:MAG: ankyrin repeat domain-containing protein [Acidobacteria bacterium]|nr:ankyrin repeat domain-containing protein [Acidobacteriota bacterium]MBI3427647.1 ankyrin repeat domain-containing protein [Acidobacteriota bacterium]